MRVLYDDDRGDMLVSRDADNVGRVSVPGDRVEWTFQDDAFTYREARDHAGEPILALPFTIWSQSYTLVRESDWDSADGFYWAPLSAIEREGWDDVEGLRKCLRAELGEMASELQGDIYGYEVVHTATGRVEDSCWGFIGEPSYAMSEGRGVAEWANLRDAINWASLPEWVQNAVLIEEYGDAIHTPIMGWLSCRYVYEGTDAEDGDYYLCVAHGATTLGHQVSCEKAPDAIGAAV